MVKTLGMGKNYYQTTTEANGPHGIYSVEETKNAELLAIDILAKAQDAVEKSIEKHQDFLLELSAYLAIHPMISKKDLTDMAKQYIDLSEIKDPDNYYAFKSILSNKIHENKDLLDKVKAWDKDTTKKLLVSLG